MKRNDFRKDEIAMDENVRRNAYSVFGLLGLLEFVLASSLGACKSLFDYFQERKVQCFAYWIDKTNGGTPSGAGQWRKP